MVPFSGWIKYLLRWALLIILFLQCLKRSQAPAFWKQLSLACTWKMYESDTRFSFFSPPQLATAEKEPWKHLTSVTNCWVQKTKINKPLWHTVGIKTFSLHCNVLLWSWFTGLNTRGTTEPKPNSVCWTEFPKDFSAAVTLKVLLPYIQHSLVSPTSSGAKSGCWPSLLFAASLQYLLETLHWWLLFSFKVKESIRFNLNNCVLSLKLCPDRTDVRMLGMFFC